MNWHDIYNTFPINNHKIWLNNCGVSPAGSHILKRLKSFYEDFSTNCIHLQNNNIPEITNRIKKIIASLIDCESDELAIIHNTAEGVNFISRGLDLSSGDEILLLEDEYPSNYYPWLHWKKKGVSIKIIPNAEHPDEFFAHFTALVTEKTKVVSLSAVHWCTGLVLPIDKISAYCDDRGIKLFLDGAQGIGHVPVKMSGVSFMAASTWKWLMGPVGLGILYVNKSLLNELDPVFCGTGSVENEQSYLPYRESFKMTVDRYEYSTPNYNDWIYLDETLQFLSSIGFKSVMHRLYELADHLHQGLIESGFRTFRKDKDEYKTAIITFDHEQYTIESIQNALKQKNIVTAIRANRIRIAPHIYNSYEQIDTVIDALNKITLEKKV